MAVARFDALRTVAAASITASYTAVGSPIGFNYRLFDITNNTDGDLFISFDGTINNMFIPAGSMKVRDLETNSPNIENTDSFVLAIGTQIYVKYNTIPTTGDLWIEGIFAKGVQNESRQQYR